MVRVVSADVMYSRCVILSAIQVRMNVFAGGTIPAQWEDVTGTTPLSFINDTVVLTTSVSARYLHVNAFYSFTEL